MKNFWISTLILPMVLSCTPINQHDLDLVRSGYLKLSTHDTIGKAFGGFLGDPKWTTGTSADGLDFVNVDGKVSYSGKDVGATVQFVFDKDGTKFKLSSLAFNGVPQSGEMLNALVKKAYASAYPDDEKILGDWGMFKFNPDGTVHVDYMFVFDAKFTLNAEQSLIVFDSSTSLPLPPYNYNFVDDDHLIMTNSENYKEFTLVRKSTPVSDNNAVTDETKP